MMQVEPYDAHMHYPTPADIDVQMQASSSEPWYRDEATMEEVETFTNTKMEHVDHADNNIEVDMEDDTLQEGNTEYFEMDDGEDYGTVDETVQLHDIEISEAHTPLNTFQGDSLPAQDTTQATSLEHSDIALSVIPVAMVSAQEQLVDDSASTHNHELQHRHVEDPQIENHEPEETTEQPFSEEPPAQAQDLLLHGSDEVDDVPITHVELENGEQVGLTHGDRDGEQQEPALVNDEEDAAINEIYEAENIDEHQIELSVDDLPVAEAAAEDTSGEERDPHEISEGVYIDPPPAVLITLPSSDLPEVSLFNLPPVARASASPSLEGTDSAAQALTLLLHHRPTLYYEPLLAVFEALRQEDQLSHIIQGELFLDAYDLQLSLSEDNIYAREVTLHDLNVLHDGSDISGPLRLKLECVTPRFIERYHLLQDQISRLNLAAETGAEVSDKLEQEQYEEVSHDAVEPTPQEEYHQAQDEHDKYVEPQEEEEHQLGEETQTPNEQTQAERESHPEGAGDEGQEHHSDEPQPEGPGEDLDTNSQQESEHTGDGYDPDNEYPAYDEQPEDVDNGADYTGEYTEETGDTIYPDALHASPDDDDNNTVEELALEEGEVGNDQSLSEFELAEDDTGAQNLDVGADDSLSYSCEAEQNTASDDDQNTRENALEHLDVEPTTDGLAEFSVVDEAGLMDGSLFADPEALIEQNWDDSLDAEGDADPEVDQDAASDKSSATLSSMSSTTKRRFEDVEEDGGQFEPTSPESLGHKRQRFGA